jgi:hypothetical protein
MPVILSKKDGGFENPFSVPAPEGSPAFTGRNRTGFRAEHERLPQDYELCLIHELFPSLTETASGGHPCCVCGDCS